MHFRNLARDETNHDISLSEIIKYVACVWLNSKKVPSFIVSSSLVVRFIDVRDNTIEKINLSLMNVIIVVTKT